jgi:hypothetical protein
MRLLANGCFDVMEQVSVGSSGSGAATQVDVQLSNTSGSFVLHWGIICKSQGYV